MAYQVPDYANAAGVTPFEFTLPDGTTHQVRSFNLVSAAEISRIASAGRRDDLTPLVTTLSGDDAALADALWALPIRAVTDLYTAWQRAAGISQGESRASSAS